MVVKTYDIYQGSEVVGVVEADGEDATIVKGDHWLEDAIKIAVERPATVMSGGSDGDAHWDSVETFQPGQNGHLDAVLTGGALVKYGYVGVERES